MNIFQTFAIFFFVWFSFGAYTQGHKIQKRILGDSISSNRDYTIGKNETENLNPKLLHKSADENNFLNVTTFFSNPQNQNFSQPVLVTLANDNELSVENQISDLDNLTSETPDTVPSNTLNKSQNTTSLPFSKFSKFKNETSTHGNDSRSELKEIESEMDVVFGFFETTEPKIINHSLKDSPTEFESFPIILSIFATANKSGLIFGGLEMEEDFINKTKAELPGHSDLFSQNQSMASNLELTTDNEVILSTSNPLKTSSSRNNLNILQLFRKVEKK